MKKILLILGFIVSLNAYACTDIEETINNLTLLGDLEVTFKPNGDADVITCSTKYLTVKDCEHLDEQIRAFYHKKTHTHD